MKRRLLPIPLLWIVIVVIAVLIAAGYLYRDSLKQKMLSVVADRLELSNLDYSGLNLTASGIRMDEIHVSHKDDISSLKLTLKGIKLGFSVFPLDLSELIASRGTLAVHSYGDKHGNSQNQVNGSVANGGDTVVTGQTPVDSTRPADANTSVQSLPTRLLDLNEARIDRLTASIRLPGLDNGIRFDGAASWTSDGDNVQIVLKNDHEQFTLRSDADLNTATLTLESTQTARDPIIDGDSTQLHVEAPLSTNPEFNFSAHFQTVDHWIRTSATLPTEWRTLYEESLLSIEPLRPGTASTEISGRFDRSADWPVSAASIKMNWQNLRRGDCRVDGSVQGILSSSSPETGSFRIGRATAQSVVVAENCIDAANTGDISTRVLVTPRPDFEVSYDLNAGEHPYIEVNGPIEFDLERESLAIKLSTDNLRLKDAWHPGGLPLRVAATIDARLSDRNLSESFGNTEMKIDAISLAGSLQLSQEEASPSYDIYTDGLRINIEGLDYQTGNNGIVVNRLKGTTRGKLQFAQVASEKNLWRSAIDVSLITRPTDIELEPGATSGTLRMEDLTLNAEIDVNALSGNAPSLRMNMDYASAAIELDDPGLQADTLEGRAQIDWRGDLSLNSTVSVARLRGSAPLPPLVVERLRGELSLSDNELDGNGIIHLTPDLLLPWSLTSHSSGYTLDAEMTPDLPALLSWVRPALGPIAESVDLTTGDGAVKARLVIEDAGNTLATTATLRNLSGGYEDMEFADSSIFVNAVNALTREVDLDVSVPNGKLANGTEFNNLAADIRMNGDRFNIDQFMFNTFDADFAFGDLSFGQPDVVPGSVIRVEGLDLERATAELGNDELQASGRMSGEIPFRIVDTGVVIDDGYLESDRAGTIAYRSDSTKGIEGLNNIALQALENFQYENITLNLGYTEDGEYLAKFKLSGNNPDLYDGYPVVLNLNINGQLPGLLRSTLIGGSFDEEILRTLPRQQKLPGHTEN